MAKKLSSNLQGWAFYKICFNQESLPIIYHNFCHKSLKVNWKGSQAISCKANCSQRDTIHLADHTK